jgi:hypothetical protein
MVRELVRFLRLGREAILGAEVSLQPNDFGFNYPRRQLCDRRLFEALSKTQQRTRDYAAAP